MEKDNTNKKLVLYGLAFLAAMGLLTLLVLPYINLLEDPAYQQKIRGWVEESRLWGMAAVFLLQMAQVVAAFVPGEAVELLAGVLYGPLGGLVLCLAGCVCATSAVFGLVRRFGGRVSALLFAPQKLGRWKWLENREKSDLVIFLLFFLPGTPKDMLTYVVGLTDMKLSRFLVLTTVARIPSVVSSTMMGASVAQGRGELALAVFAVTGLFGIAGLVYKDKALAFCRRRLEKHRPDGKNKTEAE